jgi:hypothetical protein
MGIFKKEKKASVVMTLDEVTSILGQIRVPTSLVFTPTNLESEKKKFLSSDTYNPNFKYRIVKNNNEALLKQLSLVTEISGADPRISGFYIDLIEAKRDVNELMNSVGDNSRFTEIAMKRFKMPSPILFRNASRILRGRISGYQVIDDLKYKKQEFLTYEEISDVLDIVFEYLELEDWKTEKSINIANNGVKVGIKKKEVLMDPNIKKRPIELRKTIIHELTHVIRAHNGALSGFEALSKANLPSYLDIEEGLAGYNEEYMGVLKSSDLTKRAAKVWAINIGKDMSFRDLYNATLAVAPRNLAFEITYRVKRGLGDTSKPGIYPRDISYFRGFRRVRKKIREDQSVYEKLYAGKIGFKQIKWVEDGLIPKPKLVPTKEDFEKIFKKAGI